MYIIRKQFKFECAHQLSDAYSDCCKDTIHGHSYIVEVFFKSSQLDKNGMVIDFGEISDLFKNYINNEFDHALFISQDQPQEYIDILFKYNKKLRIVDYNSTAENMAKVIYFNLYNELVKINKGMDMLYKVRVHETTTGWAEYCP